ncbi:ribonuclease H-like domain-containing protein [Tanacetum coccineum]
MEFSRLSGMDNDLFTYEVEVTNIPCNSKMDDDSEDEADDDMGYDPFDIYWIIGDDEVELTDEESSDDEDEIAKVFRLDTNIFDYETPLCSTFNKFNYLLKVDPDLLTKDIMGFKTYEDYKDDCIYEWNKDAPWVYDKPWLDQGIWKEPTPVKHTYKPFNYKTGCSEWPTCSWREDGYCNGGNLPGTYIIGNQLHYQDYEMNLVKEISTNIGGEFTNLEILTCWSLENFRGAVSSPMVAAAKLPVLNPGEFELWKKRIEQYFLMTDYALWEVIVNGDSPPPKRTVDGVEQTYPPTIAEAKLARMNESKARGTLLMALSNEHQLEFNNYKCAKTLMEAIEKRFGGNKESKKTQKTLLNQLEILGETISQEDMNLKFLRSLPSEWKTYTLIWRNKPNLYTLSMDDLYNNMKIYETEIDADDLEEMDLKWQMAMLTMRARRFLNKTRRKINTNGSKTIGFNKSKVECYNYHKKGHFTRECRALRENKNREPVRRNVTVESTKTKALVAQDRLGYNWSDQAEEGPTNFTLMAYTSSGSSSSSSSNSEVSTCSKACLKSYETLKEHYDNLKKDFNKSQLNVGAYKAGLEFVEARLDVYKKNEIVFEEDIKILKLDIKLRDNALTELRKKFDKAEKERDDLKLTLEKYKTSEGYHAVPLPYTGNFMPPKYYLVLADEEEYVFSESVTIIPNVTTSKAKTSVSKPKFVGEPLIKDWISDSKDENDTEFKSKQIKPSFAKVEFVKSNEHVKTPRESVKKVENKKQAKYPRKNSQSPRDCDFYEKKMVEKTVWNNATRVNHQITQRMSHPHPKGIFFPKAVLMKSGIKNTDGQNFSKATVSVNTARPINTAYPRPTVNSTRTTSNIRRSFNKSTTNKNNNLKEKVNAVKGNVTTAEPKAVVSDNKGNEANDVKASVCWVWRPKQKVLDQFSRHNGASMNFKIFDYVDAQGRSKHMTGNKSYLSDYEEIYGGFVAFGGDPNEGRITGKGKISTGKLDFKDVTECVVLSPDFKLLDENHVLLRVPRKENMYSVDLKNIVPSRGLTCLFGKATLDESNLWH